MKMMKRMVAIFAVTTLTLSALSNNVVFALSTSMMDRTKIDEVYMEEPNKKSRNI